MFEMKLRAVDKKESSTETDEGLGSTGRRCGSGSLGSCSAGSGSLYLSDSQDWVVSPDEAPAKVDSISPLLAEETLRYMTYLALEPSSFSTSSSQGLSKVLSADRVEQMTKTYNDIDVVTQLLAERDRDLELAARIGQSLLQRNHLLQERNEALEDQLAQAVDQVHQLQHELTRKDELLRMVASEESDCMGPPRQPLGGPSAAVTLSQLEHLQSKLQELEEENQTLRTEAALLKSDTVTYEEKEQQLVSDCVRELRESSSQMGSLSELLAQKQEELQRQQQELNLLLSQMVELQRRVKELALEKEELQFHLQASKDAQRQLTAELDQLTEANAECVEMLHESQQELRALRSRSPSSEMSRPLCCGPYPTDSLAAEIQGTMRRERSVEDDTALHHQRIAQKKVFHTVRSVNTSRPPSAPPPIPGSGRSPPLMTAQPFQSAQGEELPSGRPGSAGGNDLTRALHRLSLRRQNLLSEQRFFQVEQEKQAAGGDGEASGCSSPTGSAFSSFSNLSEFTGASSTFRTFLPEKLQIVKPMEGSLTLHHWQQLAKPHLATILDPHPGVVTKGFRPLAQDAVYLLSDMEEDERTGAVEKGTAERGKEDEDEEEGGITFNVLCSSTPDNRQDSAAARCLTPPPSPPPVSASSQSPARPASVHNPGKSQSSTSSTYTFTTCRILHPTDLTQVTHSSQSGPALTPSSLRTGPSTPVTPCRLSLGDSFLPRHSPAPPSGLAKLVLEKGISAQVSTASPPPQSRPGARLLSKTSVHWPPGAPVPPPEGRQQPADHFLASRPAELFLQDVYGRSLGRAPHPDLPSPSQETAVPSFCPTADRAPPSRIGTGLVQRLQRFGFVKSLRGPDGADSSTLVSAGGGSLMDGLRRNQSLPAMIGARSVGGATRDLPPPHPTSLALPPLPRGTLQERPSPPQPPTEEKHRGNR